MRRYIDRDLIERRIHETMDMQDLYLPIHFIQLMDEQDAVDVAGVKHGRWVQTQAKDESGNAYYSCSVCGSGECHVPEVDVPFCWKCGSRMDEVKE